VDDIHSCFLSIFLGGPYIEKLSSNEALTTTLFAVTAAVVGVVLSLAVWFGLHVIFPSPGTVDWFAIFVGIVAFVEMVRWKWDIVPAAPSAGFAGLIFKAFLVIPINVLPPECR
jgi:chromate transporter